MALARLGRCCRSLVREPVKGLLCGVVQPGSIEGCVGAKRHLLSEDIIRLQDFQKRKLDVRHLAEDGFEMVSQKLQKNEVILKDDLKLLLHLCQSAADMVVVKDAMYSYHAENQNTPQGDYNFGPIFMRQCYELGLEDMAASTLTDKNMRGFFKDTTSHNIVVDMLFSKGSYEEALKLLGDMKSRGIYFTKDTLTLAFGTCYKLNTPESYRICTSVIEEQQSKSSLIPRQAYCFAVALAINQNDIEKAEQWFSQIINTDSKLCQNLKVLLLIKAGGTKSALAMLSEALLPKIPAFVKKTEFSLELIDMLILQSEGVKLKGQVEQIKTRLVQAGQVTQQTLDDMLCHAPSGRRKQGSITMERRRGKKNKFPRSTLLSE
ncbi:pentatricopeptide repeat-containing protein 2%2C mitochondrial [Xyrichtys novacula]|nr:pentatricopeptide repeat-containing protein 2%2C mitochondrial [Xyrichtys novacula]